MPRQLFLMLTPEALTCTMLDPNAFGVCDATGTENKAREAAMFFDRDPDFRKESLRIQDGYDRCVPHENGTPKRSIYIWWGSASL